MIDKKVPYADLTDSLHILKMVGKDYTILEPSGLYEGSTGRKVRLTKSGLTKIIGFFDTAGVKNNPILDAATILMSMDHWQKSGGAGKRAIDYRGTVKTATISSIGNINLRCGGNKNGKGGFFDDRMAGDTVKVSYSKDGNSITITRD
jgi:hypothetical protein